MAIIGVVADDLTGATTVGTCLARAGVRTAALFKTEFLNSDEFTTDYDAVVVTTDSRALPKEEAMKLVSTATTALMKAGVKQFSKRTDTTLRGGIGAEIDAMLDQLGSETIAVMVPAMPQSNRVMIGGYSIINNIPLSKTPVANDVRTPVKDSYVPRLISGQTRRKVGLVSLDSLIGGKEDLKKSLKACRENGSEILLVDAISKDDVELIAEAVVELEWNVLAVDPGPFTESIAKAKGWASSETSDNRELEEDISNYNGTVLVVAGSPSPVTAMQMTYLRDVKGVGHVPVEIENLISNGNAYDSEVKSVSDKVADLLNEQNPPKVIIIQRATHSGKILDFEEEEQRLGMQPGEAANNMNMGLGQIVKEIFKDDSNKINGLYMTGGDVMVNVCKALGGKGIELVDYVIPQADLGRLIGGKYQGLPTVGKGGLTGDAKTPFKCVIRLFNEKEK